MLLKVVTISLFLYQFLTLCNGYTCSTTVCSNNGQKCKNGDYTAYSSQGAVPWRDARTYCRSLGVELASFQNADGWKQANCACKALDNGALAKDCWIGLNDINKEGEYVWSSSDPSNRPPFTYGSDLVPYKPWEQHAPNDNSHTQNTIAINVHNFGFWQDWNGVTNSMYFVCDNVPTVPDLEAEFVLLSNTLQQDLILGIAYYNEPVGDIEIVKASFTERFNPFTGKSTSLNQDITGWIGKQMSAYTFTNDGKRILYFDGNPYIKSYDLSTKIVTPLTFTTGHMDGIREHLCLVIDNNDKYLYVIGDVLEDGQYKPTIITFDLATNTLINDYLPSPLVKKQGAACLYANNKIYVFGGLSSITKIEKIDVSNPSTAAWSVVNENAGQLALGIMLTSIPNTNYHILTGGHSGAISLSNAFVFNDADESIQALNPMKQPRYNHQVAWYPPLNRLYVFGGIDSSQANAWLNSIEYIEFLVEQNSGSNISLWTISIDDKYLFYGLLVIATLVLINILCLAQNCKNNSYRGKTNRYKKVSMQSSIDSETDV